MQVLQDMIGDLTVAPEPIEIKLFSQDPELLNTGRQRLPTPSEKINGVVDVLNGIDNTISGPAVTFQIDPSVAARAGFTPEEVAIDASAILEGEPRPRPVVANDRAYTMRVRFPDANRASLEAMRNTLLISSTRPHRDLGIAGDGYRESRQTEIRRENLQREVAVTARLEGRDLGSGMADVQKVVVDLHIPPSIRVEYGGTYQEQQKSFHDLVFVLVLAVVLVFIVLLFEFRTFAAPLAILASALLSTSGVFIALLITRTTFNISSFMGLIMVVGIVAKNGILLLDADQKIRVLGLVPRKQCCRPPPPVASHRDDRAGHRRRNAAAGLRPGRRFADAAAAGHRRHRRHSDLDGAVADHHPRGALLSRRQRRARCCAFI